MVQKRKTPDAAATATEGKSKSSHSNDTTSEKSRQQRWRERNPKSYLCHLTVQNAMRLGLLTQEPCEVCGNPKGEAHHDDYSQPLAIRWLCRAHHKAHHASEKGAA